MTKVIGVRFREVSKVYYFDPGKIVVNTGEKVIVDTSRGLECGTVVLGNREVNEEDIVSPLREVKRKATDEDIKRVTYNRSREAEAFRICKEKIIEHGHDMKLISAEYSFDNTKVLFYFTSDGRVDFRELVKDLAMIFKLRIELRQVGVRDETRMVGGIGTCGRALCCHSYLSEFAPVSIKMAKEQNLSLNPQKISGVCGRLMCCLKNEAETYEYLNSKLPKIGEEVETPEGRGTVSATNVLRQKVKVVVEKSDGDKEILEYPLAQIREKSAKKPYHHQEGTDAQGRRRKEKTPDKDREDENAADNAGKEFIKKKRQKNKKKARQNN